MVRLKVFCQISNFLYPRIISIPYGAIKSKRSLQYYQLFFIFQFLMVRLKVSIATMMATNTSISIPYGAIKSPAPASF